MRALEAELLDRLVAADGDLLGDDALVEALANCKAGSDDVIKRSAWARYPLLSLFLFWGLYSRTTPLY